MNARAAMLMVLIFAVVLSSGVRDAVADDYPDSRPDPRPYYPPPYYPPPYYPPPHYPPVYYPPPSGYGVIPANPERQPYRQGDPIPPGYELRSEPRVTLLTIGLSTTGGLWLLTATIGMTLECLNSTDVPGAKKRDFSSLYIPAFGPFLATGIGEPSSETIAWLVADGVLQTAGLVTAVFAFAFAKQQLVRKHQPTVRPTVSPQMAGLEVATPF